MPECVLKHRLIYMGNCIEAAAKEYIVVYVINAQITQF